jgi:non-ribosomal peptide synthase protein (TIGR01720 family)
VAGLAAVARAARPVHAEQGEISGPVPLTPIQHWFFAQKLPKPHHWNQAILLKVQQPLDLALLEQAFTQLLQHHDALRLRFTQTGEGWHQVNAPTQTGSVIMQVDLSEHSATEQIAAMETAAADAQAGLDLAQGPLLRAMFFHFGPALPSRLLIVIHHLVVDGVSWRILLDDLMTVYEQLRCNESIALPPKTTSFQYWATQLTAYADSPALAQQLDYWLQAHAPLAPLPVDMPGGANTEASAQSMTVSLTPAETRALLQEVPAVYRTQINDVLLTALAQTHAEWTGASSLLVDLEGHGREELFEDVDLSRTVGWFTSLFPVHLDLSDIHLPAIAIKSVKEQLRRIPHRGIGYGLLRYLCQNDERIDRLRTLPRAELNFNYLGQLDRALPAASPFILALESPGPSRHRRGHRQYLMEINGSIMHDQLQITWTYSKNIHRSATIEYLANRYLNHLRALIAHCQSPEAGGYTPSDFPLAGISQKSLDAVTAKYLNTNRTST